MLTTANMQCAAENAKYRTFFTALPLWLTLFTQVKRKSAQLACSHLIPCHEQMHTETVLR